MVACQEKAHSQVKREVMMNDVDINIERNLSRISEYLLLHKQTLVTAESCTGGLLAAMITACSISPGRSIPILLVDLHQKCRT